MKMIPLTVNQLIDYENNGFIAPIDILSAEEAKKIKTEIEYIETK